MKPRAMLAFLVVAVLGSGAVGEETDSSGDPATRLRDAQYLEMTLGRSAEALDAYARILKTPSLSPEVRGNALLGAARCETAQGHLAQADTYMQQIVDDRDLPADVRAEATQWQAKRITERSHDEVARTNEEAFKRAAEETRRRNRERSLPYIDEARQLLGQRRFEPARQKAFTALQFDPESVDAKALLDDIADQAPDKAQLIRSMMEFFYSVQKEVYQRLRARLGLLEREGKDAVARKDHATADEKFRTGLDLIYSSEFLGDLDDERASLALWLRRNRDAAQRQGLSLPPEPVPPDPSARESGFRGQFFQVLSQLFTSEEDTADPLVLYEAVPAPSPGPSVERSLGPNTFGKSGIAVSRARAPLTRAEWAERFIRAEIDPGSWPVAAPNGTAKSALQRRLLVRYGNHLVVQNTRSTQDRVAQVLSSFDQRPAPMQIDVAVFAASEGGTIAASGRLRAQAVPQESGVDLVVARRLIEEATQDLDAIAQRETDYLTPLGTARIVLRGETSTTLELTQRTEKHPVHFGLQPPALTIPRAEDQRYGLSLELYAEDLPHAAGIAPSAALSVRARSRWPVPSFVVPKTTTLEQTRLPRFAEQVVEADRRLPHAGTLLLLGVANPFSPTAETRPDLVILIGVRRAPADGAAPAIPDPPRSLTPSGTPEEVAERAHYIGALATEVVDDVTLDGWPQRPASLPVSASAIAEARGAFLAQWLSEQAGVRASSKEPNPISIRDLSAYARVAPDAQERIAAAAQRLVGVENVHYEIDVLSTEVTEERVRPWATMPGLQPIPQGEASGGARFARYVVDAPNAAVLDGEMRANDDATSLYAARASLLARATQMVAVRQLRLSTIVEDLRPRRNADGTMRFVPLTGRVEEGLIVEARPDVEDGGRRLVRVRVRAARIDKVQSIPILPAPAGGPEATGPSVQVPAWHPIGDYFAAAPLADGEAILLLFPAPEAPGRAIAVKVTIRRVT